MLRGNGVSSALAMNSSLESTSSLAFSESSTVGGKFRSPSTSRPSNGKDNVCESGGNRGTRLGFQSAEALVEDGIKHACQQLTMKLNDIHMASKRDAEAATRRSNVAAWLNSMFDRFHLPDEPSEEDLRACLSNGSILCQVMNRLNPGSIPKIISNPGQANTEAAAQSAYQRFENVRNFLVAIDDLRLPTFEASDLEQGSMVTVVDCLLSLKEFYDWNHCENNSTSKDITPGKTLNSASKSANQPRKRWMLPDLDNCTTSDNQVADESPEVPGQKIAKLPQKTGNCRVNVGTDRTFDVESLLSNSVMSDSTSAWIQHVGQKFREVLQVKAMRYTDIQAIENSGVLKCLDNAPSQSLLNLVSAILGDKQNEEVPSLVEFMLRKVMEEFERRLLGQGEHIKKLKHVLREVVAREEKIVSRTNALEALAAGSSEEIKLLTVQLQKTKMEKKQVEDEIKVKEQDMIQLIKERKESETAVQDLKDKLEMMKKTEQEHVQELESQKREVEIELQAKLQEMEDLLALSKRKNDELEAFSSMELQTLKHRDSCYQKFLRDHVQELQEVKIVSELTKEELLEVQKHWQKEIKCLEEQLMGLANAATKYHKVLAENRQLYNEVQDLKGNIRVYCRVRPFLSGQSTKQTTIEYIGENGELLITNPNKHGKDAQRMFNFNKVFGPCATQEEVFIDTQPLIRSVLDGYNVCIFAYGQTGSGKTFTMTGPTSSNEKDWGVNYRALNDLFQISQKRRDLFRYEVGVQMIEIYNEQVRDLLTNDGSQKRLGIRSISQPNGLCVPEASMLHVESTADVLELMKVGQRNRAVGATALNERSSRSHSVLTVHVQGMDLSSGSILRGCLHLVDLAGSERVDRSEVTGDRLREAQHINKSLSALGDVISALANKSAHVPYRNSKLTHILQDSLGGQAKTLMFVQLNPDIESYSETISTLKFADRVSGVELGAARSNKESKDIREMKEQVAMLKDVIAKKDSEIERLHTLKEPQVYAQDVFVNHKLKVKASNSLAQSHKATSGQGQRTLRLTTGRPRSSEGNRTLTGQTSKYLSQQPSQDNNSQDRESVSTADSEEYSTQEKMRRGMASKISMDSKMRLSNTRGSHLKTKQHNDSLVEKNDAPKEFPDRIRSSNNFSLVGTASQDEAVSPCSGKMEKMDLEGISLVDNLKRVSDADNASELSDKNSNLGLQDTSMYMADLMPYKDQVISFNRHVGNMRSSYSSLESAENVPPDVELLGLTDGELEERLSEISDGDLSMGTETDGSISSVVELTLFPVKRESGKVTPENDKRLITPSRIPRPPIKSQHQTFIQPQTRAEKHSNSARGIDHSSSRRLNGQSANSTGAVNSTQKRGSQRPLGIDSPYASNHRSISQRQSASSQPSGSSSSTKRWQ